MFILYCDLRETIGRVSGTPRPVGNCIIAVQTGFLRQQFFTVVVVPSKIYSDMT